ncbi:MAG: OmpA family protein [Alphaproteobacteria bacterium]|nr:OmpA family protein [Alphaproteobacteria bacterium]
MKTSLLAVAVLSLAPMVLGSPVAHAAARSSLLDLGKDQLKSEVQTRYDAALAATLADDVRRSEDTRFTWASEAKVQCGIALGFLKSGNVDEDSVNRCDAFSARLVAPPPPPPMPPVASSNCPSEMKGIVFFDWDADTPLPEASETVNQIVDNRAQCGWTTFTVIGHTDKSGPDAYNSGLSLRRAKNVAAMMESAGIATANMQVDGRGESQVLVETADGVREPQNRRVEISAGSSGQ